MELTFAGAHVPACYPSDMSAFVFVDQEGGDTRREDEEKERNDGSKGDSEGRNGRVETTERQR